MTLQYSKYTSPTSLLKFYFSWLNSIIDFYMNPFSIGPFWLFQLLCDYCLDVYHGMDLIAYLHFQCVSLKNLINLKFRLYSIYNNNPQQNTNIKYYTINSKFRIHNLVEDVKMYAYSLILTYNKHNSALNNNQQSLTKMFRYFKFSKLNRKRVVRKFFNAIKKYLFNFI